MDIMKEIGYVLLDYQQDIIKKVCLNIENQKKMQTVLLPNMGGKTSLSFILAIKFKEEGKKVLYFAEEGADYNKKYYAAQAIRTDAKKFEGIDFGDISNIRKLYKNHYDIVIADAIHASFSEEVLSDFENNIRNVNIEKIEKQDVNGSITQKALIGLHYLQEMIERDGSYVISFDLNKIEDIGYAPIISAPNVLTYKMSREQQIEYGCACAEEFETVSKKKMYVVEQLGNSNQEVRKYDATLEVLLEKLDKGFASMDKKLDNLQNDVTHIMNVVDEMNDAVHKGKGVLSLYFSVHNDDDHESELFISKFIDKMTFEMLNMISKFESQDKYHKIKKLVMVRLGDNVWNKLECKSQKFLISAKFMFMQNMELIDDIDYSSICLLSSKAFEVELAKRFLTGYETYLDEKKVPENEWPKSLLTYDKKSNTYRKMELEDFTLGSCPYIMGILGNSNDRKNNRIYFEKYCREKLLISTTDNDIIQKIQMFDEYIRNVKNKYRNPAAHKNTMTMSEASECLDYILEIERVLKNMLEQFTF